MSANTLSKPTLVLLAAMGLLLSACNDDDDDDDDDPTPEATYVVTGETTANEAGTQLPTVVVNSTANGVGAANRTWSSDTVYILNGAV